MEKNNIIQIALLSLFVVGAILAVLLFSGKIKSPSRGNQNAISGTVTIWGTLPAQEMKMVLDTAVKTYRNVSISYRELAQDQFEPAIIRAIAEGKGPDLFMLSQDQIMSLQSLISPIPYASYPKSQFESTFIDMSSLFLSSTKGILAIPFGADPMVLYANRDLLAASFVPGMPKTWDEVRALAPKLVQKTEAGAVTQALVPIGSPNNVRNHADIVSMFFLQAGSTIISQQQGGEYRPTLMDQAQSSTTGIIPALNEIVGFSDPRNQSVGWSSALPNSLDVFVAGRSAFYLGYGTESLEFSSRNQNLDVAVGMMPQRTGATRPVTYARIYGISIAKGSSNPTAAFQIAAWLAQAPQQTLLSSTLGFASTRRDVLAKPPVDDTRATVIAQSAIAARGWLDPDSSASARASATLIQAVASGASVPQQALQEYVTTLGELITERAPSE